MLVTWYSVVGKSASRTTAWWNATYVMAAGSVKAGKHPLVMVDGSVAIQ